MNFKTPSCLLCECLATEHFLEVSDHVTGRWFTLRRCAKCDFVFTALIPENLDEFYPKSYRNYHPLLLIILGAIHRLRMRPWRRTSGSALEIGCGHGFMLAGLRDIGWRVIGIERSEESAAHARNTLGLPVIVGSLDAVFGVADASSSSPTSVVKYVISTRGESSVVGRQFDLIIMNQVLEHLPDPMNYLHTCARLLKPSGELIIGVPNLNSWQFRFGRRHTTSLDVPRHLCHFTPDTLRTALYRAGLRMESIRTVNLEYDPFAWVQSTLNFLGFPPFLLLHWLSGTDRDRIVTLSGIVMVLLTIVLSGPALLVSVISWLCGAGGFMQVSAKLMPANRLSSGLAKNVGAGSSPSELAV